MRSCNTFADFFPFRDFSRIFSILAAKLRWAEARSAPFCVSMSLKRGERAAGPKPRSDYITIKSSLRLSAKCTCRKLVQLFTPSTGENCSTLIVGEWRAGEIMVQECVKRNILLLLSLECCGVSANENICAHQVTWSRNKLRISSSIFNLCTSPTVSAY